MLVSIRAPGSLAMVLMAKESSPIMSIYQWGIDAPRAFDDYLPVMGLLDLWPILLDGNPSRKLPHALSLKK